MPTPVRLSDIRFDHTLWTQERGQWIPVTVLSLTRGVSGPKVRFRWPDGREDRRPLDAFSTRPD